MTDASKFEPTALKVRKAMKSRRRRRGGKTFKLQQLTDNWPMCTYSRTSCCTCFTCSTRRWTRKKKSFIFCRWRIRGHVHCTHCIILYIYIVFWEFRTDWMNIYFILNFILLSFACFSLFGLFNLFFLSFFNYMELASYPFIGRSDTASTVHTQKDQVAGCSGEIKFTLKIIHGAGKKWKRKKIKSNTSRSHSGFSEFECFFVGRCYL